MSTLEYIAEKQISLNDEKSFAQRNNEKNGEIYSKTFVLSENDPEIHTEIITKSIFQQKGFISNESWSGSFFISSKVIKIQKEYIECECIISKESKIIQTRQFPILLFSHISQLQVGALMKIKISQKPGSTRTDIIDGKGLGIEKDFELFNIWDQLEEFDNKPF